jgi:transcriptional regulator with XRE-family HTH domain
MATTTNTTTENSGSPLRAIRARLGMSQERLCAESGLSRGWVGFLERNPERMSRKSAAKLAAVLGVTVEELQP